MAGSTLPGTENRDSPVVLHVDMDCFYASCERRRDPSLRGEPVVVAMGYEPGERRGAVATASYEAREHGVESAQSVEEALRRLPRRDEGADTDGSAAAYYRPVDMPFYESVAAEVRGVLEDCADVVRAESIDEAYLDVSDRAAWKPKREENGGERGDGSRGTKKNESGDDRSVETHARRVKQIVERVVGVPASVGAAPNMSAAKVASDHDKPDGMVVVPPGEVRSFLAPLPVEAIHGVGPVTAATLREMGVERAGELAETDPAALRDQFGDRGPKLGRRARGEDDRTVTPRGRPKSLSRESSFDGPVRDAERVEERALALAADVAERARAENALYRTIGVKVVLPPFDVRTRERTLPGPVDDPDLVADVGTDLLAEFAGEPVRKIGVRVAGLSFPDGDQASLDRYDGDTRVKRPRRHRRRQASLDEFESG